MAILIAALAALALSLLGLLPLQADALSPAAWKARDALLAALAAFLAWQGLAALRGAKSAAMPRSQPAAAPAPPRAEPTQTGEALILLALLQEKGRFLDYLMEDIGAYSDAQVAAASRVVHQGCAAVIRESLALAPAHAGKEGDRITVEASADAQRYRLIGKLGGAPPYSGVVLHRGWKSAKLALPRHTRPIDPSGENLITPIEVEVR